MKSIFCIGVYDLFHFGHLVFLDKASKLGELTVGVVRDQAVRKQKGSLRPIISENERADLVGALKCVTDWRFVDDFKIPKDVLSDFDFIIIGEDQNHITNLDDIPIEKKIIFPRYPGTSTSTIIQKIKDTLC